MSQSRLMAPAKLTVYLHITGVRDNGYHEIDAEMVSLDLADELIFSESENGSQGESITISGPEATGVPIGKGNLVSKALALADRSACIHLVKNIPHGGGLGGGSSDAAAVLRWAGVLDPLRAAQIGSDVPFCLRGGRARVRGLGELIEPLKYKERSYTLLLPPFGVNTAEVYKAFDELNPDGRGGFKKPNHSEPDHLEPNHTEPNHLEEVAIRVEPRLIFWREKMKDFTGKKPILAGSGSTWFVEGKWDEPPAEELQGARWVVTRTTQPN